MKKIRWILPILLIFLTTGCLNYTELNDIGIISTLGIVKVDEQYHLDINILNPTLDKPEEKQVYEVEAPSISEAFDKLYLLTSKKVNLSHLELLILNKELKKEDYDHIINFFLNRSDSRNTFPVVIYENYEKETLFEIDSKEINQLIKINSEEDGIVSAKTFDEMTEEILNLNTSYIPTIQIGKELKILGYRCIYEEDKLLTLTESISYNFLTNQLKKANLIDSNLNLRIEYNVTTISTDQNKIHVTIFSTLTSYNHPSKGISEQYEKILEQYLTEFVKNNNLEFFRQMIKKYHYQYYISHKDIDLEFQFNIKSTIHEEVM